MNGNHIEWDGLGFPVVLIGFPMISVMGEDVPDVNMNVLQEQAFRKLISWPHSLTGQQVRFARSYLRQTQAEFAKNIHVNPSLVSQWEGRANEPTRMETNNEVVLRLYMLKMIDSPAFRKKNVVDLEWRRILDLLGDFRPGTVPLQLEKAC